MAINENDIGLVSYDEFDAHQKNSDTSIQHVTADEKDAWNAKADETELADYVKQDQFATATQAGIVKLYSKDGKTNSSGLVAYSDGSVVVYTDPNYGTNRSGDGKVTTAPATAGEIEAGTQEYKPITPVTFKAYKEKISAAEEHITDNANPHSVTKEQVGLGNVDNAKQATKEEFDEHKEAVTLDHPDGSVTAAKLADGSVITAKIADNAVTESKLGNGAVTAEKLGAEAVGTSKIEDGAVTTDKLGTNSVDSGKIADTAVTAEKIGTGAVETAKIKDNAVETDKIAGSAVTAAKLADNAVETAKIKGEAVTSDKISASAVETDKIKDTAVTAAKIDAGAVETAKIADTAVTESKLSNSSVTNSKLSNGAVTAAKISTSAVETDKIKDTAVTAAKIAANAVTGDKLSADLTATITGKEDGANKGQPNGYAPLDENGKLPDSYLYGVTVKQYGVRWKGTSSTVCERLGDAVGLVANAHKGSEDSVDNDFDNIYPWSDIRTCNIDDDGNVLAYLGEPSFARDGSNGDVMVEIPKFYYKRVKTGVVEEIWICGVKLPGYELHPLFIDDGKEVSKVFHSVYNASSYTDESDNKVKLQSITGVQPRVRTTRANFRTYARNKGAIWGIEDISCVNALQLLYLVEYANTHSQSMLGSGADSLQYSANHKALVATESGNTITIASTYKNTYKIGQRIEIGTSQGSNNITATPRTITAITTDESAGQTTITFDGDAVTIAVGNMMWNVAPLNGSCDALNGKSGWLAGENNYTDHYADVNYRGIEGFHAKLFRFIDGVNIKDRVVYYANSITEYADGVYDGIYRAVGYTNAEANGYVSAFGYDEKAPWVMFPTAAAGGSSTFVPDYYYQDTGERLFLLGGAWHYGSSAGAFCFSCTAGFSRSYLHYGAHLLAKKP